jgi:polysaccharide pyruvyl transferase WcaK-like protein
MVKKNVFIYGYYGLNNLGDDLLIFSIITTLQRSKFAENYYIRNYGKVSILGGKKDVVYTYLEQHITSKKNLFQKIVGLYRYIKYHQEIIKTCHSMILGGGTLLSGHSSSKSLFLILLLILVAKIHNTRVYGIGLGVAKINNPIKRFLTRRIINNCDYLGIRDTPSLHELKKLSTQANFHLTSDLIFGSGDKIFGKAKISNSPANTIGVSIVGLFLKNNIRKEIVLKSLIGAIEFWVKKGTRVKLLSFQNPNNSELNSDRFYLKEILDSFKESDMVSMVDIDASILSINSSYNDIDIIVGMRFHGAVLASMSNTPFVGFSCDNKISSLCNEFSMPYIDVDLITSRWIINSVYAAINIHIDNEKLESLRALSEKNYDFLIKPGSRE